MTNPTRGAYAKSALIKRHILESCVPAIVEHGLRGVTMAEVARRAGISHSGLLHHFPTKEALIRSVLTMQDARAENYLREQASTADDDPLRVVRAALELLGEDRAGEQPALSVLLAAEGASLAMPAHEHFARRYRLIREFLARQFGALAAQGRLETYLPPTQLAAVVVATVEGIALQRLYAPGDLSGAQTLAGVLAAFIPELRTPSVGIEPAE
jgi:AcrR family transcriptional regulator